MPYQVADAQGRRLYLGEDLGLACEIYHLDATARLSILTSEAAAPAADAQPPTAAAADGRALGGPADGARTAAA